MKSQEAREYVEEILEASSKTTLDELTDLVIWAYDQGWVEGREDYKEEQDPTECQVRRESR